MLNETFFLNGVDALSVGIRLQEPIVFSGAKPVVKKVHVAGRNGDVVLTNGDYANRKGKGNCFALSERVQNKMDAASMFLFDDGNYKRLETTNDAEHYWLARVDNGAELENRLRLLNPFSIKFDCKPQRFCKDGEYPIAFSAVGSLFNAHQANALPMIKIYGNGAGTLTIGEYNITIKSMKDTLYLDCDTQTAYNDSKQSQSGNIKAFEFPRLTRGNNTVGFSGGVTKVEIIPRWWDL